MNELHLLHRGGKSLQGKENKLPHHNCYIATKLFNSYLMQMAHSQGAKRLGSLDIVAAGDGMLYCQETMVVYDMENNEHNFGKEIDLFIQSTEVYRKEIISTEEPGQENNARSHLFSYLESLKYNSG